MPDQQVLIKPRPWLPGWRPVAVDGALVACLAHRGVVGDAVAGGQGVGVVRAEHPLPVGEQLAVLSQGGVAVATLLQDAGELETGDHCVGVVDTEPFGLGRQHRPVLGLRLLELTLRLEHASESVTEHA